MRRRAWLVGVWPGLAQALEPAPALQFPADHGAHPGWRIEWWYATGWLAPAAAGTLPTRGFQVTFFRRRTAVAADHPSAFAARQLVFAHAALTDLSAPPGAALRHDQRIARAGFGLAQAQEGDTAVALRGWRLQRQGPLQGPVPRSVYTAQVASPSAGFALDLALAATQPLLLQGEQGLSRKGPRPELASHYYSQPQLQVSGTLTQDGQTQAMHGRAWLDHEWGDTILDPAAVGWDWIGMNLHDGAALTAFRLRRADGSALWAGGSFRAGPDAPLRVFAPDEVRFTPLRRWASPATRSVYPVQWQIDTPAGRWQVHALRDAQELDSRASTGTVYWEGLSELRDEQQRRVGWGYLELTGYGDRLRL